MIFNREFLIDTRVDGRPLLLLSEVTDDVIDDDVGHINKLVQKSSHKKLFFLTCEVRGVVGEFWAGTERGHPIVASSHDLSPACRGAHM
jgi:hypothetical protein